MKKVTLAVFQQQANVALFSHPAVITVQCYVKISTERCDDNVFTTSPPLYDVTIFYKTDKKPNGMWNLFGTGDTPEQAIYHAKIEFNHEFPGAFDMRQEVILC